MCAAYIVLWHADRRYRLIFSRALPCWGPWSILRDHKLRNRVSITSRNGAKQPHHGLAIKNFYPQYIRSLLKPTSLSQKFRICTLAGREATLMLRGGIDMVSTQCFVGQLSETLEECDQSTLVDSNMSPLVLIPKPKYSSYMHQLKQSAQSHSQSYL